MSKQNWLFWPLILIYRNCWIVLVILTQINHWLIRIHMFTAKRGQEFIYLINMHMIWRSNICNAIRVSCVHCRIFINVKAGKWLEIIEKRTIYRCYEYYTVDFIYWTILSRKLQKKWIDCFWYIRASLLNQTPSN